MEMFKHMGMAHRVDEVRAVCPGNLFHLKGIDLPIEQMPTPRFSAPEEHAERRVIVGLIGIDVVVSTADDFTSVTSFVKMERQ